MKRKDMKDTDKTTIQVKHGTLKRMKNALIIDAESYDHLINRMLDAQENLDGAGK